MEFLEALRKKFIASNMSVKQHAEKLGVPRDTLYGWVNGRMPRSVGDRVNLYKHFSLEEYGVDIEETCRK